MNSTKPTAIGDFSGIILNVYQAASTEYKKD